MFSLNTALFVRQYVKPAKTNVRLIYSSNLRLRSFFLRRCFMKLMLVRHAESMGNATGEYSTALADSLSPRGHEQARALVDLLKALDFAKIICSPLERTRDTVKPYLESTGQRAEIWPEIAEACWHDEREGVAPSWHPQPASPLSDAYQAHFYYRDAFLVRHTEPESFGEGLFRVHSALGMLQEMTKEIAGTVLLVTHGHFIRETLNLLLDTRSIGQFHHANCGMTLLVYNKVWEMEFCNRLLSGRLSIDTGRRKIPDLAKATDQKKENTSLNT